MSTQPTEPRESHDMSHIVGPALTMNSPTRGVVQRQRCLWCGVLILDNELERIAVPIPPDGSEPEPPGTWEPGAVVRVTSGNPTVTSVVDVGPEDSLPGDACSNLDWAVTT